MRTPKPFYRRFNDTWYVQIGKQQVRLAKGKANEAEAYRRYFEVMAEHPTGRMADPLPDPKVAFVCDLFLEWCQKHNAPRTYQWYRDFLQNFCEHCGKMALSELKPFHVTRWLDANPDWNGSRRGAISAVKRAFNWAVEQGLLTANPVKGVKKPPPRARERFLTPEERRKIFDNYPEGDCFRDFLFALEHTGCRPGEVGMVTAEHANLAMGVWVFDEHKTEHVTAEPRIVILTPEMVNLTRWLIAEHPEGPLFRNEDGQPWSRNAIRCRFRRVREKLQLGGDLVAYLYRHAVCTDLLESGTGIAQAAEILGHKGTEMIMRHYSKLRERREHLRDQLKKARGEQPSTDPQDG